MGQINPFSAYSTEAASLDRRPVSDRESRQQHRDPKQPKPQPQAEDQVELHSDAEQDPPAPAQPISDDSQDGHVDVTA
jgi:hypothetical protein